jgi:hypothetical protein
VKPTRAQVVGTLLLALVFFAYLVIRFGRLFG